MRDGRRKGSGLSRALCCSSCHCHAQGNLQGHSKLRETERNGLRRNKRPVSPTPPTPRVGKRLDTPSVYRTLHLSASASGSRPTSHAVTLSVSLSLFVTCCHNSLCDSHSVSRAHFLTLSSLRIGASACLSLSMPVSASLCLSAPVSQRPCALLFFCRSSDVTSLE